MKKDIAVIISPEERNEIRFNFEQNQIEIHAVNAAAAQRGMLAAAKRGWIDSMKLSTWRNITDHLDEYKKLQIASTLKALRANREQQEVAQAIGISVMSIRQYESGERIPNDDIKLKLATYYGKSAEEIFFD